jgi:hypothetical protein
MDLLLQSAGLVLLAGGLGVGYWRWIRPHAASLDLQGKGLLLLILLTLMGGFIGSPFWWADAAWSFAWDVPPLASRMLASAGWSFCLVCVLALQRPSYRRVRLVLLLLFTYLTPLALAILLFHLDRFDPSAPITYAFFAIVGPMVAATLWYLLRQPGIIQDELRDAEPSSPLVRNWLALMAVVTALWGLALFATDNGPSALIWVWPGDLLSSRLIGVMLLAIAVGSIYSLRYADGARQMLAMTVTYGLGLAVGSLWNALAGKPVAISYAIVFGLIFLVSGALLLMRRQASEQ